MQTQLVQVGNSKGIRIPKALLMECGLEDKVSLRVTEAGLLISPEPGIRCGWEEALLTETHDTAEATAADPVFTEMATPANEFDSEEWKWPNPPQNKEI